MPLSDEINKAVGEHGQWRARLRAAFELGQSDLSPDQARADRACNFGRWLHGPDVPSNEKASPEYQACRHLHAEFHKAAAEVLSHAHAGKRIEAEFSHRRFTEVAADLTIVMMRWLGKSADRAA